jgi:hypothetical protein
MTRLTVLACIIGGAITLGVANAQAQSTMTCAPVTQQEIAALFERWNASLATHEADKVTANYAPDAVLLPTVMTPPASRITSCISWSATRKVPSTAVPFASAATRHRMSALIRSSSQASRPGRQRP